MHSQETEGLGWKFWAGLVVVTLVLGIGFMIAFMLFGAAWYAWGFVGAVVAMTAVALGVKAVIEHRARSRWS